MCEICIYAGMRPENQQNWFQSLGLGQSVRDRGGGGIVHSSSWICSEIIVHLLVIAEQKWTEGAQIEILYTLVPAVMRRILEFLKVLDCLHK